MGDEEEGRWETLVGCDGGIFVGIGLELVVSVGVLSL
jgi:hypothetical protein